MESLLPPACRRDIDRARDLFLNTRGRWRIIYHNDGDGVASASVLAHTLVRLQTPFQLTPLTDVDSEKMRTLVQESHGPILVADTGTSLLPVLAAHDRPVLVLDHHRPPAGTAPTEKGPLLVNPHHWGVDGMTELSASMLCYLFALTLDPKNIDLIPWGLSGAIADRQHVGGFQGLNQVLLREAERRGELATERALPLSGRTLGEALASTVDPYLVGISGHPEEAQSILQSLSLDPAASPELLSPADRERLAGTLLARLVAQGARPEFCERVSETRYRFPRNPVDGVSLSLLQNATARENEPSVGIALALGDPRALAHAWELEAKWRREVLHNLHAVEASVERKDALQWFRVTEPSLGGAVAGYAITFFLDPTKPAFAMAPRGKFVKVSARATRWLVDNGLDLDAVCRKAAESVHGQGGGHRVASGATIPPGTEERFLEVASSVVGEQLSSLRGAA